METSKETKCFRMQSLPQCLRHSNRRDALNDARAIASFLQIAVTGITSLEYEINHEEAKGADLCFDLLIDKIDIGRESYHFPMGTINEEVPGLCERENW